MESPPSSFSPDSAPSACQTVAHPLRKPTRVSPSAGLLKTTPIDYLRPGHHIFCVFPLPPSWGSLRSALFCSLNLDLLIWLDWLITSEVAGIQTLSVPKGHGWASPLVPSLLEETWNRGGMVRDKESPKDTQVSLLHSSCQSSVVEDPSKWLSLLLISALTVPLLKTMPRLNFPPFSKKVTFSEWRLGEHTPLVSKLWLWLTVMVSLLVNSQKKKTLNSWPENLSTQDNRRITVSSKPT